MRTSFSRVTKIVAVSISFSVICAAGCSTTSSSKASPSNWFNWGKKKPASSTLGANTNSNLPAPPSGLATPNTPPSYAQSSATRGGASMAPTGGSSNPSMAASASPWNSQGAASNPYAAGNRQGTGTSYDTPATPTGYSRAGAAGYAAGGYPDNNAPSAGAYGPAASMRNNGGTGGSYAGGAAANPSNLGGAAGQYTQNPYAASAAPAERSQAWGGAADNGAARLGATAAAAPAGGSYGPRYAQDTTAGSPYSADHRGGAASTYGQHPNTAGAANSYAPPGGSFGQDRGPQASGYADNGSGRADATAGLNTGSYRPGTTGRNTRFGNSQQINVSSADGVQSASFNTGNEATSNASISDRNAPAGGAYDSGANSGPPQRTATGSGAPYANPNAYTR